jgi:hypothetical protein
VNNFIQYFEQPGPGFTPDVCGGFRLVRICRFSYLKKPKEQLYAVYQKTDSTMTKRKRTNNNLQHTALKTKDRATKNPGRTQVHRRG